MINYEGHCTNVLVIRYGVFEVEYECQLLPGHDGPHQTPVSGDGECFDTANEDADGTAAFVTILWRE